MVLAEEFSEERRTGSLILCSVGNWDVYEIKEQIERSYGRQILRNRWGGHSEQSGAQLGGTGCDKIRQQANSSAITCSCYISSPPRLL
jgi:hypothetical protein